MSTLIVVITIVQFHNCEGCREKVENTVDKIDGAKLLTSDPGNGKFRVSTAKYDPDVIVYALKPRFPTKEITWSKERTSLPDRLNSNHKDRPTTYHAPLPPRARTPSSSSRSIPKPEAAVYQDVERLITDKLSVEITQAVTVKLNIRKQDEKQPTGSVSGYVDIPMPPPPRSTIQPSAPPLPSDEDGFSTSPTSSRHEKRPVATPMPPPATKPSPLAEVMARRRREKRQTTSSSVTSPVPPPPPPRTTKPSTQPTPITEDVVRTSSRSEKRPSTSSSVAFPVPPRTTNPSARPTTITEDAVASLTRLEKQQTTSRSVPSPRPPRTTQQAAIRA